MNQTRYLQARAQHGLTTLGYLAVLVLLLLLSGWLMLGSFGLTMMLLLGGAAWVANTRLPVAMILRLRGARRLALGEAEGLERMVASLAARAGVTDPVALYALPSRELQAFALTSGGHAAIAVTPELVRSLTADELEGVLAHEVSHLRVVTCA